MRLWFPLLLVVANLSLLHAGDTWPQFRGPEGNGHTKTMPSRPSPLLVDDQLFIISSEGVATSLDANTGQVVWQERIGGKFSASPIHAAGRIYLFDESSVTTVFEPAREFKRLAVNKLADEELMASPAVAGNSLFIRTATHLYRIEETK